MLISALGPTQGWTFFLPEMWESLSRKAQRSEWTHPRLHSRLGAESLNSCLPALVSLHLRGLKMGGSNCQAERPRQWWGCPGGAGRETLPAVVAGWTVHVLNWRAIAEPLSLNNNSTNSLAQACLCAVAPQSLGRGWGLSSGLLSGMP